MTGDKTFLDRMRCVAPNSIADLERKAAQEADPIARQFARAVLADLQELSWSAPELRQAGQRADWVGPRGRPV